VAQETTARSLVCNIFCLSIIYIMSYNYGNVNDQKQECELIHKLSETTLTVYNNDKVEDKLNVICVHQNYCKYTSRKLLAEKFIAQMLKTEDVRLYVVELVYGNNKPEICDYANKNHLIIHTSEDNVL